FGIVYLVRVAADTPARTRWCLRALVGGIAATACIASVHFLALHGPGDRLRATGHYMTFAGLLCMATPPCAVAAGASRRRRRAAYAAALSALTLSLALSFTRGAWLGVTAGLAWVMARERPRWAWVVPVAVALAFAIAPAPYRQRAISSFDPHHPQNADRLRLW